MLQSAMQEEPENRDQAMHKQIEQPNEFANTSQTPEVAQPLMHDNKQPAEREPVVLQQAQQQQAVPFKEKTKVEWHQLIGAARQMWSKISEAELLASEGEEQKLTRIVSARYVLSHNTANVQVKKFLTTQLVADWFQPAS